MFQRCISACMVLVLANLIALMVTSAFVMPSSTITWSTRTQSGISESYRQHRTLQAEWKNNLDEASDKVKKAGSGGMAETATGAVLGGLILGPFGALFGAQLGANLGAKNSIEQSRKDRMKELGVTPEMLAMAQEVGVTLNRAVEGLNACRDSLASQQALAKRIDSDIERLYEDAKSAMSSSNEDRARELLFERDRLKKKLKQVLKNCVDERRRVQQMESNVEAIEDRAMEVETLLNRSVGAKALGDTSDFAMNVADPLLEKFKDLER